VWRGRRPASMGATARLAVVCSAPAGWIWATRPSANAHGHAGPKPADGTPFRAWPAATRRRSWGRDHGAGGRIAPGYVGPIWWGLSTESASVVFETPPPPPLFLGDRGGQGSKEAQGRRREAFRSRRARGPACLGRAPLFLLRISFLRPWRWPRAGPAAAERPRRDPEGRCCVGWRGPRAAKPVRITAVWARWIVARAARTPEALGPAAREG